MNSCLYRYRIVLLTFAVLLSTLAGAARAGDIEKVNHPFLLWTADEIAEIKKELKSDEFRRQQLQRLLTSDDRHNKWMKGLVRYALLDDENAGRREVKKLMRVVNSPVPRGGAQWVTALRYDLCHDLLTDQQKQAYEKMVRTYVKHAVIDNAVFDPNVFNDSRNYSRYDARRYTKSNWLPNIIWPRKVSANLLAASLADEKLIRKAWSAYGSWKWYFDHYLSDMGFYQEEFSKMGSTPGAMIIYCKAVENLGLNELGFGYKGKHGATMRGHIRSLIAITFPRVDIESDRPHYPLMTTGDLRQSGSGEKEKFPTPAFQHALVMGFLPDGTGGNSRWAAHGAWGGEVRGNHPQWDGYSNFTPKMMLPFWFELGHKRWPKDGYGYFLAAMRKPDQKAYQPSLLMGLDAPIAPKDVSPPPAPCGVYEQRGLVMLRADQSPAYWTSSAPTVGMRLASPYAHHVRDSFALTGFYAYNRPIYLNRQVTPGYAKAWSRSVLSHAGVRVDQQQPAFTRETTVRKHFGKQTKFLAAHSTKVYEGVDLTRALLLTREYLLDATRLASEKKHTYDWLVHALGEARYPGADGRKSWPRTKTPKRFNEFDEARSSLMDKDTWRLQAVQVCVLDDPGKVKLPKGWYDRKVGVNLTMLGGEATSVFTFRTPRPVRRNRDAEGNRRYRKIDPEVGGVSIAVTRHEKNTVFTALHEPFEKGKGRGLKVRRLGDASDKRVTAVAITGDGVDDRAMVAFGDDAKKVRTVGSKGESFTFAGWAWIRLNRKAGTLAIEGDLKAMTLKVPGGAETVRLNGRELSVSDGVVKWQADD
ncbi:MAG: hypothetical protein ACOCVI_03820 [Planctomycetota bacterium]